MEQSTLAIIGSFIGMLLCFWRIASWYQNKVDETVAKVFKRFDDHKDSVDKKLFLVQDINNNSFVRKDNCSLQTKVFKEMFTDIKKDISGVKSDVSAVKEDISGVKTDISGISSKIDAYMEERRKNG